MTKFWIEISFYEMFQRLIKGDSGPKENPNSQKVGRFDDDLQNFGAEGN